MSGSFGDIQRTLLFLRKNNQILLGYRKKGFGKGKWHGIGGALEKDSPVEPALVRESTARLGIKPTHWNLLAELDLIQDGETSDPWNVYIYAFICDSWEGIPTAPDDVELRWFPVDKLPYEQMWPADERWLSHVLAGKKVVASFTFDVNDRIVKTQIEVVKQLPSEAN